MLYAVFCVATAISTLYEIVVPCIRSAQKLRIVNSFTEHPWLSMFVAFVVIALTAPIAFIVMIVPGMHERYYFGLSTVIHEEQKF